MDTIKILKDRRNKSWAAPRYVGSLDATIRRLIKEATKNA